MMLERGVVFQSQGKQLVGVLHQSIKEASKGVVIVVGGPQTRVGSHRLFVYIARALAKQGIAVFRFDYSGAGDSEGEIADFQDIQQDISDAIGLFKQQLPQLNDITLWGLCDAASAILLYLEQCEHDYVTRLVLVNPWVRQASTQAQTYIESYYTQRIFNRSFWKKVCTGKINVLNSVKEFLQYKKMSRIKSLNKQASFVDTMEQGLLKFNGKCLIILSGNDLTADEFNVLLKTNKSWQETLSIKSSETTMISEADHTFSNSILKRELLAKTLAHMQKG